MTAASYHPVDSSAVAFETAARAGYRQTMPKAGAQILEPIMKLDLFVGESSGAVNYYENTGDVRRPEFTLISDEYQDIDVGRRSMPVLRDIDQDGDLDLLVGSESEGIHIFRNDGTPAAAVFVAAGTLELEDFGCAAPALPDCPVYTSDAADE